MTEEFNGDDAKLCSSIDALLALDASGALVPHGVGGHARTLLAASASRLRAKSEASTEPSAVCSQFANREYAGLNAGALTDDAKDAAPSNAPRCTWPECICTFERMVEGCQSRKKDAAIAASTSKGEG